MTIFEFIKEINRVFICHVVKELFDKNIIIDDNDIECIGDCPKWCSFGRIYEDYDCNEYWKCELTEDNEKFFESISDYIKDK